VPLRELRGEKSVLIRVHSWQNFSALICEIFSVISVKNSFLLYSETSKICGKNFFVPSSLSGELFSAKRAGIPNQNPKK
jgi:hypothetical protein